MPPDGPCAPRRYLHTWTIPSDARLTEDGAFFISEGRPSAKPITFQQAIGVVRKTLHEDPDMYRAFKDNIAMAFQDTMRNAGYDLPGLHSISDEAAKMFLDRLIG